jgi:hypothetical protein
VRVFPGGAESPAGETEVDTGRPTVPATPDVESADGDTPAIRWKARRQVRYQLERADAPAGPFSNVLPWPVVATADGETLTQRDEKIPPDGAIRYYRVVPLTPLDRPGRPSLPIPVRTPDRTPPAAPLVEEAAARPALVAVRWQPSPDADVAGYHVYRREVLEGAGPDGGVRTGPEKRLTASPVKAPERSFDDATAEPARLYQYRVSAIDRAGNEGKPSGPVLGRPKDVAPPRKIGVIEARVLEKGRVALRWRRAPEPDVSSYRVYRGTEDADLRYVGQVLARDLPAGRDPAYEVRLDERSPGPHRFAVSAVDRTDNEGERSDPVSVRLPDRTAPAAPIIAALEASDGRIKVRWQPPPDRDVAGYRVFRAGPDGKEARLGGKALGADARAFEDATAEAGVVYRYSVSAVDAAGNEGPRAEPRSASTFARKAAPPPANVRVAGEPRKPALVWDPPPGATGYVVYAAEARDGEYRQVGDAVVTAARLPVVRPAAGEAWFRVQAVHPGGRVSELSEPVVLRAAAMEGPM